MDLREKNEHRKKKNLGLQEELTEIHAGFYE